MNPLCTSTYYATASGDSPPSRARWTNYISDATLAKYQADAIGSFVEQVAQEQIQAIDDASRRVAGTACAGQAP